MKSFNTTTAPIISLMCFVTTALATDHLVPQQYPTIQAAINASSTGDTVQISPGTYSGPIDTLGKAITVRGTGAPAVVIVSGGASVVRCTSAETNATLIENLTITNGSGLVGAGVRLADSSPTIRNCRVIGNTASGGAQCRGGGIQITGGNPKIEDCLIGGNSVVSNWNGPDGTGFADGAGGGIAITGGSATIVRTVITGNLVRSNANGCNAYSQGYGAGIHKTGGGYLLLSQCQVLSNALEITSSAYCNGPVCVSDGAGAYLEAPARIESCAISGNSKVGCGSAIGGVRFANSGIEVYSTRFCGNTPGNTSGSFLDMGGNVVASECLGCTGDIDGNGIVNAVDLAIVLSSWGPCPN